MYTASSTTHGRAWCKSGFASRYFWKGKNSDSICVKFVKAAVDVVSCPSFNLGLPAYYILALSEASRLYCFQHRTCEFQLQTPQKTREEFFFCGV